MATFTLTPGNAVSCYVNTHRSAWDGSICDNPTEWNCAANPEFRRDFCARGTPRCYHLSVFNGPTPSFLMDDYGAGWVLGDDPQSLDDQVLLIFARQGLEPEGIPEEYRRRYKVSGAYRVKEVKRVQYGHRVLWEVHPYEDGWTRFHQFNIDSPRFEPAGGPYIKQIDRELVLRVFSEAAEAAERPDPEWTDPNDAVRFQHFHQHLTEWLDDAARSRVRLFDQDSLRAMSAQSVHAIGEAGQGPLSDDDSSASDSLRAIDDLDSDPMFDRPPLLEDRQREWVRRACGDAVCTALQVASLTKEILILRGNAGVGKSHLAARLLDDPHRLRTLIVPVSATWRSTDELFDYAPFPGFLIEAAGAWQAGDRRARVVVFEEFTLSQPDHWMSDILVAAQSTLDRDRHLHLGDGTKIFLSPAIRFVGTINEEFASPKLSSRILDRSAVVEIRREPRQALACAGLRILEDMTMAIADLDFLVRSKGAGFSLRSALSLRACLAEQDSLEITEWDAVDIVLAQEVLSKVQLIPDDPYDESIVSDLKDWLNRHGIHLSRCSSMISEWEERLRVGVNITHI